MSAWSQLNLTCCYYDARQKKIIDVEHPSCLNSVSRSYEEELSFCLKILLDIRLITWMYEMFSIKMEMVAGIIVKSDNLMARF